MFPMFAYYLDWKFASYETFWQQKLFQYFLVWAHTFSIKNIVFSIKHVQTLF